MKILLYNVIFFYPTGLVLLERYMHDDMLIPKNRRVHIYVDHKNMLTAAVMYPCIAVNASGVTLPVVRILAGSKVMS